MTDAGTQPTIRRYGRNKLEDKTSKHLGVSWNTRDGRWLAKLKRKDKLVDLGRYKREDEAVAAVSRYLGIGFIPVKQKRNLCNKIPAVIHPPGKTEKEPLPSDRDRVIYRMGVDNERARTEHLLKLLQRVNSLMWDEMVLLDKEMPTKDASIPFSRRMLERCIVAAKHAGNDPLLKDLKKIMLLYKLGHFGTQGENNV